ncbi:hypothetical protein YC2023_019088 [Brassica napus]
MELMCVSIVRSLALFAAGCSLNAEELAISKLGLPRPPRISEMLVEELDANEKQAFLNWRRMFVRGVLVHALQKREIIARAKTGTAKTVTGNTTLDVKAERTCRRCSHTSEIHAKAKKEMRAQDMFVLMM